jgi:hypothetical protein
MTGSPPDPPLSLAKAEDKFGLFLSSNGYPWRIRWITAEQIVVGDDRHHFICAEGAEVGLAEATLRYSEGLKRGLGILLQAICATPSETIANVYAPTDSTDAQYRLMGRGLKLSCPTSMPPASIVYHPLQWDLLAADFRFRFEIMRQAYDL